MGDFFEDCFQWRIWQNVKIEKAKSKENTQEYIKIDSEFTNFHILPVWNFNF